MGEGDPRRRHQAAVIACGDTLLPKLISGELRVKDAEKFVSARDAAMADTRVRRARATCCAVPFRQARVDKFSR